MTPRQRQVVELLRSDATDEQVARSVGVSVRTVRKDVSSLMAHFNVRTRFALGDALVRHDGRCRCDLAAGTV
ncbi:LuxR C-terminal-related transcriptional regulator [Nocardioides sp. WG-D5]